MNIDGEGLLLSEMQDMGIIQNCGWFKKLFKKVVKVVAVAAAVVAVAAVVVATVGSAAPAVVAVGIGAAFTGTAIASASLATAAISGRHCRWKHDRTLSFRICHYFIFNLCYRFC